MYTFFYLFYACNWASTYYFHVYCPAFSNICQHKVITKKLEGGGQGKEGGGCAHLFIHFERRDPSWDLWKKGCVVPNQVLIWLFLRKLIIQWLTHVMVLVTCTRRSVWVNQVYYWSENQIQVTHFSFPLLPRQ